MKKNIKEIINVENIKTNPIIKLSETGRKKYLNVTTGKLITEAGLKKIMKKGEFDYYYLIDKKDIPKDQIGQDCYILYGNYVYNSCGCVYICRCAIFAARNKKNKWFPTYITRIDVDKKCYELVCKERGIVYNADGSSIYVPLYETSTSLEWELIKSNELYAKPYGKQIMPTDLVIGDFSDMYYHGNLLYHRRRLIDLHQHVTIGIRKMFGDMYMNLDSKIIPLNNLHNLKFMPDIEQKPDENSKWDNDIPKKLKSLFPMDDEENIKMKKIGIAEEIRDGIIVIRCFYTMKQDTRCYRYDSITEYYRIFITMDNAEVKGRINDKPVEISGEYIPTIIENKKLLKSVDDIDIPKYDMDVAILTLCKQYPVLKEMFCDKLTKWFMYGVFKYGLERKDIFEIFTHFNADIRNTLANATCIEDVFDMNKLQIKATLEIAKEELVKMCNVKYPYLSHRKNIFYEFLNELYRCEEEMEEIERIVHKTTESITTCRKLLQERANEKNCEVRQLSSSDTITCIDKLRLEKTK